MLPSQARRTAKRGRCPLVSGIIRQTGWFMQVPQGSIPKEMVTSQRVTRSSEARPSRFRTPGLASCKPCHPKPGCTRPPSRRNGLPGAAGMRSLPMTRATPVGPTGPRDRRKRGFFLMLYGCCKRPAYGPLMTPCRVRAVAADTRTVLSCPMCSGPPSKTTI
jgi:hypothetical protein